MKLRSTSSMLAGWEGTAELGTDLAAAPDGSSILLVEDHGPVKPEEAAMLELEIVEASSAERQALADAGFDLPG